MHVLSPSLHPPQAKLAFRSRLYLPPTSPSFLKLFHPWMVTLSRALVPEGVAVRKSFPGLHPSLCVGAKRCACSSASWARAMKWNVPASLSCSFKGYRNLSVVGPLARSGAYCTYRSGGPVPSCSRAPFTLSGLVQRHRDDRHLSTTHNLCTPPNPSRDCDGGPPLCRSQGSSLVQLLFPIQGHSSSCQPPSPPISSELVRLIQPRQSRRQSDHRPGRAG